MLLAKYWGVSPSEVEQWTMPEFLKRQEFMWIRQDVEDPPPKEEWKGPGT